MKLPPRRRRRLVVQLAALVDLLFVVMFLQFTELQQASARAETARAAAETARADASKLRDDVLADQAELRRKRDELANSVDKQAKSIIDLKQKVTEAEARASKAESEARTRAEAQAAAEARSKAEAQAKAEAEAQAKAEAEARAKAEDQVKAIGTAAKDLLQGVDPSTFTKAIEGASEDQRTKMLTELKDAQQGNVAHVVQVLRKSAELRKRCDIWEVHLFPDGFVRVRAPDIQERKFAPKNGDDFCNQFMQIVKDGSEPKSLVLILFTHGNAEVQTLAVVTKGLDQVKTVWSGQLPAQKSVQITAGNYSADAP